MDTRFRNRHVVAALALIAAFLTAGPLVAQVPATPASVGRVLHASPCVLEQAYTHAWRRERPQVRAGYLLVLEVDPALVVPRQGAEPVLYVGRQTAQRFNVGYGSGRVVAFVPSDLGEDGGLTLDLATAPIWFGAPELPERVDAARIADERRKAAGARIRPRTTAELQAARAETPGVRTLADQAALFREAGALVIRYAPDEREWGEVLASTAPPPDDAVRGRFQP